MRHRAVDWRRVALEHPQRGTAERAAVARPVGVDRDQADPRHDPAGAGDHAAGAGRVDRQGALAVGECQCLAAAAGGRRQPDQALRVPVPEIAQQAQLRPAGEHVARGQPGVAIVRAGHRHARAGAGLLQQLPRAEVEHRRTSLAMRLQQGQVARERRPVLRRRGDAGGQEFLRVRVQHQGGHAEGLRFQHAAAGRVVAGHHRQHAGASVRQARRAQQGVDRADRAAQQHVGGAHVVDFDQRRLSARAVGRHRLAQGLGIISLRYAAHPVRRRAGIEIVAQGLDGPRVGAGVGEPEIEGDGADGRCGDRARAQQQAGQPRVPAAAWVRERAARAVRHGGASRPSRKRLS